MITPSHPESMTPTLARMKSLRLKVALLHSGGPAPGANRVLSGAAKQFLDRGIQVIGFKNGYEYLQELPAQDLRPGEHFIEIDRTVASDAIDANFVIIRTSRANPGKDIKSPGDLDDPQKTEQLDRILDTLNYLRVGALISIGGDDTLKTDNFLYELSRRRVQRKPDALFQSAIVHVPKTIDNDYYGIPWTFGYFTAAEAAGRIVRGLYDDAKATNCYHVVELMGRKAGWYTAAASIFARGTKAIIPEDYEAGKPFSLAALAEELLTIVLRREADGRGYGVFCVAEGLADLLPEEEKSSMERDRFGNLRLAEAKIGERIAHALERLYREKTGMKKSFKPQIVGYETRQNPPSLYDALLTSQLGVGAYRLIEQGRFGEMVTVRDNLEIDGIPFSALIDPETLKVRNRNIDVNGDFYRLLRSLEETFSQ
ncbi:MAG: 6-phosphofructokinase [Desulfobacterota bacterium]|nr:6-phosphofructokinase [Thermodesulfobacteriota bacterium]